jgi:hypothetical protein
VSAARRTLLTAAVAAALLGGLWFVPSAHAAPGRTVPTADARTTAALSAASDAAPTSHSAPPAADESGTTVSAPSSSGGRDLADTGSVNTTPYLVGGTAFLGLGAGFLVYSARRGREMAV